MVGIFAEKRLFSWELSQILGAAILIFIPVSEISVREAIVDIRDFPLKVELKSAFLVITPTKSEQLNQMVVKMFGVIGSLSLNQLL